MRNEYYAFIITKMENQTYARIKLFHIVTKFIHALTCDTTSLRAHALCVCIAGTSHIAGISDIAGAQGIAGATDALTKRAPLKPTSMKAP